MSHARFGYDRRVQAGAPTRDPCIGAAVARLAAGALVAFPTETVYGLGADAARPAAVARIFARKGRPSDHPLIVHVADAGELAYWAREVPAAAAVLAARFWPGPLTLVLARAAHVLDVVTGGQDSIALRCPAHPLAQALLAACRAAGMRGLAAPSANRYGHVSPTTAAHVRAEFGGDLMILDGGPCTVGIESTIVDVRGPAPRVLRPGMIGADAIAAALAGAPIAPLPEQPAPRVPGAHVAHYAPCTPLSLAEDTTLVAMVRAAETAGRRVAVLAAADRAQALAAAGSTALLHAMPALPADYARELYAALRAQDTAGVDLIVVETPPATPDWAAIRDRLLRAAAGTGRA